MTDRSADEVQASGGWFIPLHHNGLRPS